jgi:C_GCAxxG_C_C family probable redox protein
MKKGASEQAYQLGKEYEKEYKGCAQCTLAALQDAFGIKNKEVFKAATGLAGGSGGRTDGNCGAYSGAILFIGSLIGRERDDFADKSQAVGKNMELAGKIHDRFIEEYGSVICRNIHTKLFGRTFYLPDPEEHEKFEQAGAHTKHCPEVVGKAAQWAAELANEANLI